MIVFALGFADSHLTLDFIWQIVCLADTTSMSMIQSIILFAHIGGFALVCQISNKSIGWWGFVSRAPIFAYGEHLAIATGPWATQPKAKTINRSGSIV